MSKENAARRNRVLRKIRAARHIPLEIKAAIEVILDLLSPKSGYSIAWPSAKAIGKRLGRSRRSALWYIKAIKAMEIFKCKQMRPEDATTHFELAYGLTPRFEQCGRTTPNLFEPNLEHPLWDKSKKLAEEIDLQLGQIIEKALAGRSARTTSRLAADPDRRPLQVQTNSSPRQELLNGHQDLLQELWLSDDHE